MDLSDQLSAEHRDLLLDLSLQISERRGVDELFMPFARHISASITFDYATLLVATADPEFLLSVGSVGSPWRETTAGSLIRSEAVGIEGMKAFREGSEYIPARLELEGPKQMAEYGFERAWTAPLLDGDSVYGLLTVAKFAKGPFPPEHLAFLRAAARLLAQAVRQGIELERAHLNAARSRAASTLLSALQANEPLDSIFERLPAILQGCLLVDYIGLVADNEGDFRVQVEVPANVHVGVTASAESDAWVRDLATGEDFIQIRPDESRGATLSQHGYHRAALSFLRDGPSLFGMLVFARRNGRKFDDDEQAFIAVLRSILSQSITSQRGRERTEVAAARARTLNEVAVLLNAGERIEGIFQRLLSLLERALRVDYAALLERADEPETLRVVGSWPEFASLTGSTVAFRDAGGPDQLAAESPVVQFRPGSLPESTPFIGLVREAGIGRLVSTVLQQDGEVQGLIAFGRKAEARFSDDEEGFLRTLSLMLAQAIANRRRLALSEAEAEEQAIIAEAAAAVARKTDANGISRSLRDALEGFIPAPFVSFGYIEGDSVVFADAADSVVTLPITPVFRSAIETGQRAVGSDHRPAVPEARREAERYGLRAFVVTLAKSGGMPVGLLLVGSRDEQFVAGERELRLWRQIAGIVGPAMANARAAARERQESEDQAIIAAAAAAVAREGSPSAIAVSLGEAVARFVSEPFVRFGHYEDGKVVFRENDGSRERQSLGPHYRMALESGQSVVPGLEAREAAGEAGGRISSARRARLQGHVLSRADSASTVVGFLLIGSHDPSWSPGERVLRLCRLFADIIGPAMANARAAEREREEAEDQAIIAIAAAAAAREIEPLRIVLALREAVARFIPQPFVNFGYLDGDDCLYPSRTGQPDRVPNGPRFLGALADGQNVVPPQKHRSGEWALRPDRVGIEAHIVTRATSGGAVVGVLIVGSRDAAFAPGERDLRLCRLIADILGPAMENARTAFRARLDAEEQRILAEAAAALAAGTSEQAIIEALHAPIRRFISDALVDAFFLGGPGGEEVHSPEGVGGRFGPQLRRALEEGQVAIARPWPDLSALGRQMLDAAGAERLVLTSLSAAGESRGVLAVATPGEMIDARELRLLRLIADMAGPAFANARESRRRQEDADEQRVLAEAAAALATGSTEGDLLKRLAKPIRRFVPQALVGFSYIEGDEVVLWDGRNRRPIHPLTRHSIEQGQTEGDLDSPVTEATLQIIKSVGVVRYTDTVATSGGVPVGLLFVGTPVADHVFSDRDKRMLRLIADITGPAMSNARENRRRREEADDDRILSEVAAVAARAASSVDITDAIPAAIAAVVPSAFANYGLIEGDAFVFPVKSDRAKRALGTDTVALPMTDAGLQAQREGQGVGRPENLPDMNRTAHGGLQEYVLTTYYAAGVPAGALVISTWDRDYHFGERALALLRRMVQFVGPAVEAARAEAELVQQAAVYSLILGSLSEGVIVSDGEGRVLFANGLGRKILKTVDPAQRATTWREITGSLPESAQEGFRAVFEEGTGSRGRASIPIDGRPVWLDYEVVPLNDPVMKVLLVVTDVSADVAREAEQARHRQEIEQASRLAALGELVGGVAHELNNPLTAILGFTEVMTLSSHAAPLSEELAIVQKEALRARNIVRDLLFVVKPGDTTRTVIPVADLVAHIERLRRAAWTQQGIRWDIAIEQPCMAWGNEQQLTQVLLNLVTNAEQALTGRPERHIRIRATSRDGRTQISVSDTGSGMDEATRSRVFEPFFTTKQGQGTGLGLSLSHSIVQSHNGELRVESSPGIGTTFTFTLPAAANEPPRPRLDSAPATAGTIRVLVVDDEPSLRKVCQRLIASMGHECATADTSASAVELAAHSEFDMVLCDYRLGSETAGDVVAGLERVAPQLISRMVIATGATTDAGVIELTEKHGLRLMAKPYGVNELSAIIREVGGAAR
ncbi:MAG: GAF domain-containing protein [Dehalococcoidia bacterium]|nr:GAF domain-containing protein [Dehalococcoidia bacterium]